MYELSVKTEFSSAHRLIGYQGECENLHGHNYSLEVILSAEKLNETGIAMDFHEIKKKIDDIISHLDHKNLNALPSFHTRNPSCENLSRWIFEKACASFNDTPVKVRKVILNETRNYSVTYSEDPS